MDGRDPPLSAQATAILQSIADGRGYDQILLRHPELTYQDIFAAAQEALTKLNVGQTGHRAVACWTAEEDEQLARLFRRGAHLAEIGQALGRHNGAIKSRLAKLGLLPEDVDHTDLFLAPADRPSAPSNEPQSSTSAAPRQSSAPPAPSRSSFGWDTIRRRLGGRQERE